MPDAFYIEQAHIFWLGNSAKEKLRYAEYESIFARLKTKTSDNALVLFNEKRGNSDSDGSFDGRMRIVTHNLKIIELVIK